MANTTFVNQQTVIVADWLNDVNNSVYNLLGDGTNAPTTKQDIVTNLGILSVPSPAGYNGMYLTTDGANLTWSYINLNSGVTGALPIANGGTGGSDAVTARNNLGAAASGDIGSSGLTQNTGTLLGRGSAGIGAIEEIAVGTGLQLAGNTLSSSSVAVQIFTAPVPTFDSGAMTIPGVALGLDFRSPTLSSGDVTRVSDTPNDLIIPAGATLGTVSGEQSNLIVLALLVGSTIEYGIVNAAGSVNLSEMGVISTTAISDSADSAGVVYSTTARTNVPYRVLSLIKSTQTTAGTWAQAPSLVQGVGGNALTSLQSLGYGQTWQDVTASRSNGVTYYNTTGRPIVVSVWWRRGENSNMYCEITAAVSGVTVFYERRWFGTTDESVGIPGLIVPPGATYSVTQLGLPNTMNWRELR